MSIVTLSTVDLCIAASLVMLVAGLSWWLRLGLGREIIVAALRTTVQLLLIGLVLKALFANVSIIWMVGMGMVMLIAAGREVMQRQRRQFSGWWGFGVGTLSMFISSFSITILTLLAVIQLKPWYTPQYAIPLLGMLLGNTMTGLAVGLDRLTQTACDQRAVIEARLMMGAGWSQAISSIRKESIRSGLIPIINSMAAAGLVSLPGMMTGQILAGAPPIEAVKYQILIMFLISGGTGLGTVAAVGLGARRLFDDRHRLRLDRLSPAKR